MTNEEIEASLQHIERTLVLRWWIFGVMSFAIALSALGAFANLRSIMRIEGLVTRADERSLRNEVQIDTAMKQQIIYQQQIAASIDFLAKKNPNITVPRAIVRPPRPSVTPGETPSIPLTDEDLTRPKSPTPTPRPEVKTSSSKQTKRKRPSPTPGPFERLFNPRRTR